MQQLSQRVRARLTRLLMVPTAQLQISAASSYENPEAPTRISASRWSPGSSAMACLQFARIRCAPLLSGCDFRELRVACRRRSSTSRRPLRYSERKWLRRIVNSQAGRLVPGRKLVDIGEGAQSASPAPDRRRGRCCRSATREGAQAGNGGQHRLAQFRGYRHGRPI